MKSSNRRVIGLRIELLNWHLPSAFSLVRPRVGLRHIWGSTTVAFFRTWRDSRT